MNLPGLWRLSDALQALRRSPARRKARREFARLERDPSPEPAVAFGDILNLRRKLLHGGAVKLLPLRDAFPSRPGSFNVLYLVSSALPSFADDLVAACRKRGIPVVWNQNGVAYPAWAGHESERFNAPMRRLRAQADFVVYQSAFCRSSAEKHLGPCARPGEILFNPVDTARFAPPDAPLPPQPLRLLSLGTHGYAERVLSAIRCLAVLRREGLDVTLTIAGRLAWKGAEPEVHAEIARLGLGYRVTLLPPFSQDQAIDLYRRHHIVLHPKYLDPCPTVVLEALACGCPVIGSASGGLPELIPADCGVLLPAPLTWEKLYTPPAEDWAQAVRQIAPRLAEYSAAARLHAVQTFDVKNWVARHREIFCRLRA